MNNVIRKSTTTPELYFQIREPHTSKKGKEYTNATVFAREYDSGIGAWKVALVRCSKGDQFNRKSGRTLAKRAMTSGKYIMWVHDDRKVPKYEDVLDFYKDI